MDRKLRIFHLVKGLGRGGAETLLNECHRHRDAQRFEYGYGYFLSWKDALVADLRSQGAEVHAFESRNSAGMLSSAFGVARFLRHWRADLVHCHLPLAGVVGRVAGKLAGIPVVYTEHNLQERYRGPTRLLNRLTWKLQREVIAVSEGVATSIRASSLEGVPIRVIENGVDVDAFSVADGAGAAVRSEWDVPKGAAVVGTVAVFRTQKRLDEWLRTAQEIRQDHPSTRFLLVGDGPLRRQVEALCDRLKLRDVVRFAGLQEDVRPYLAAMDVYLMSSRFEGLPVALLEAMAMELPVVAPAVGGIREAVVDGGTGFLVPAAEARSLAAKAGLLLGDRAVARAMGRAARERVKERFSISRMVREVEAIYESALGGAAVVAERAA